MRCVASQLSVPAIGFMCSDQRQPGSHVPAIAEWSPIFTICTSPFPDIERRSSGCSAFLISRPDICPSFGLGPRSLKRDRDPLVEVVLTRGVTAYALLHAFFEGEHVGDESVGIGQQPF